MANENKAEAFIESYHKNPYWCVDCGRKMLPCPARADGEDTYVGYHGCTVGPTILSDTGTTETSASSPTSTPSNQQPPEAANESNMSTPRTKRGRRMWLAKDGHTLFSYSNSRTKTRIPVAVLDLRPEAFEALVEKVAAKLKYASRTESWEATARAALSAVFGKGGKP